MLNPVSGEPNRQITQKAVAVGLAFHLVRSFSKRSWRTLFFFGGDFDFHEAVQHLVEHEDVYLVLIGTLQTISQELRPYARNIIEIDKQAAQLARPWRSQRVVRQATYTRRILGPSLPLVLSAAV